MKNRSITEDERKFIYTFSLFIAGLMTIMIFIMYTIFFASEDSFVQDQSVGIGVAIVLIVWLYTFIRFLSSDKVEKYERSKMSRQKTTGIFIGNKSRNDFVHEIIDRLFRGDFKLNHSINNEMAIEVVATRKKFHFKTMTFLHQYILISVRNSATIKDYESLYEFGLEYAKKLDNKGLPLGILHSYMIIPCILTRTMEKNTKEYLISLPEMQYHVFQFPVGVDERDGKIYFFNGKMRYGFLLSNEYKNIIKRYFIGESKK